MILFLDSTMPVGRYAGKSVKTIIDTDLQYMIWFRKKVAIALTEEVDKYIDDRINDVDKSNKLNL